MHTVGFALFLYAASASTFATQTISAPAIGGSWQLPLSPDHAPPHPIKPRVMPLPDGPGAGALRAALELAKATLSSHER